MLENSRNWIPEIICNLKIKNQKAHSAEMRHLRLTTHSHRADKYDWMARRK